MAVRRLLICLLCLLLVAGAQAEDYCECPSADVHAQRQAVLERVLYAYQTMGASIAVVKDGRIVDTFQYGRANRQDQTPVTSDTLFRVGSISKMVTAVGVLQLVDAGRLFLDTDLSDVFGYPIRNPAFSDTPITLRQVMTHTASLDDEFHYHRATMGTLTPLSTIFTGKQSKENFQRYTPGTRVSYSNFGGGLLGAIIEQKSGLTIDEYMTRNVFAPLGIFGAYHTPCLPDGTPIARIYNPASTGMTLDPMADTSEHFDAEPELAYIHSAGALLLSADGLAQIMIALVGDGSVDAVRLLSPEIVQHMRQNQAFTGSVTCDPLRGLNLNIVKSIVPGRTLIGHQGKAYGMICAAYGDPTDQTAVVLLTNGCNTSTLDTVARIAKAVIAACYGWL